MKKILFMTAFLMSCICSNAQYFWYGGHSPSPCYENDSIYIIDTVELPEINDYRISTVINISNDTIHINSCYIIVGGPQVSVPFIERTNIGKLTKGSYIVKIEGDMTQNFSCSPSFDFINSVTFPLQVLANPTSINETMKVQFKFGSQLIHDRLVFDTLPSNSSIKIYDMQGRYLYSHDNDEKQLTIETSNWTNGIYVVSIQTNGEHKRLRVIKE
jgi:hypothetical protein